MRQAGSGNGVSFSCRWDAGGRRALPAVASASQQDTDWTPWRGTGRDAARKKGRVQGGPAVVVSGRDHCHGPLSRYAAGTPYFPSSGRAASAKKHDHFRPQQTSPHCPAVAAALAGPFLRCDDGPLWAVIPHSISKTRRRQHKAQFPLLSRDAKTLPYELLPFPPPRSHSHSHSHHSRSPTVANSRPQQRLAAVCAPYPVTRRVKAGPPACLDSPESLELSRWNRSIDPFDNELRTVGLVPRRPEPANPLILLPSPPPPAQGNPAHLAS